jgi:hypothetical protein
MRDDESVCDLWKRGAYLEALRKAYRLSPLYRYPSLGLDLRALVFCGCQQAVEQAWQGDAVQARQWVTALLDAPPPPVLIDHDDGEDTQWCQWCQDYRRRMLRAHLLCTRLALELQPQWTSNPVAIVPTEDLHPVAAETGFPPGLLGDLVQALLPAAHGRGQRQPVRTLCFPALLVAQAQDEGVVTTLTLDLMPGGSEVLYPTPELAFVVRNKAFREAEANARADVRERVRLWPQGHDVRWRLERRDGDPFPQTLTGNSLGGALALGIAKLVVGEPGWD